MIFYYDLNKGFRHGHCLRQLHWNSFAFAGTRPFRPERLLRQGVILIFIFLGGMIVALLVFRFTSERLFGRRMKP
jgi:hypothetical protein